MKCPHCNNAFLTKINREGFELGYCQSCKGIWLERGELEKIILRLQQGDADLHENTITDQHEVKSETKPAETETHNSPILDSIRNSRELHQLHKNEGKHHWMHRLFH